LLELKYVGAANYIRKKEKLRMGKQQNNNKKHTKMADWIGKSTHTAPHYSTSAICIGASIDLSQLCPVGLGH
jgi:hypothetical protein